MVAQGYGMYSEYSGLLFLVVNMFEMSPIIYANKHCEVTSSAALPRIPFLCRSCGLKEETIQLLFKGKLKAPLGYL